MVLNQKFKTIETDHKLPSIIKQQPETRNDDLLHSQGNENPYVSQTFSFQDESQSQYNSMKSIQHVDQPYNSFKSLNPYKSNKSIESRRLVKQVSESNQSVRFSGGRSTSLDFNDKKK